MVPSDFTGPTHVAYGMPGLLDREGVVLRKKRGLERETTQGRDKDRESEKETREEEAGHGLGCSRQSFLADKHGGHGGGALQLLRETRGR